jgi:hypothetical protein
MARFCYYAFNVTAVFLLLESATGFAQNCAPVNAACNSPPKRPVAIPMGWAAPI